MNGDDGIDCDGETVVPDGPDSQADGRMAELLASGRTAGDLRRQVEAEEHEHSEDLLSRLNALDFVGGIVGDAGDMPERLGHYRITGLLGRGGMGTVYAAFQEDLEREVALKVLSPSWSTDPTMRQRFRIEARATAALHHRHIVPIYDYGEAQGRLFFAMERVDGPSLDRHIASARRHKRAPMEPLEVARRFAGVADALGLAHRRRILHRDVKPGNLLVAKDGTLALTDFGLAKAMDQGSARITSKSGGFLGTLHYSSPEQAMGRELTPASDLYSLGVTMFEALSGELPLRANTTESVLQELLYGKPRRLREALPRPPRDLEAVLEKLLSKEPGDRYQDGEELARDLQRIADGDPVRIRRQPIVLRVYRRMRKNPVLSGAIIAATALMFVTFFLMRVLREEKGQSLLSRHQNNLVSAANAVRAEQGSPFGPDRMLQALVGGRADAEESAPTPAGRAIAAAAAEVAEDAIAQRMLECYLGDPLPEARALLAAGDGYAALSLYDAAIAQEQAVRTFADLSVDLRLYGLYLGRACANLTECVMRPVDARRDLDLASFLRPGAAFPRDLLAVLALLDAADDEAAVERALADASRLDDGRKAAMGLLLQAAAGLQRDPGCNLMPFAMRYGFRRRLHAAGAALGAAVPSAAVRLGEPTGRARDLQRLCREFAQALAAGAAEDAVAAEQAARAFCQRSLHPGSLLQGQLGALQLLARPRSSAALIDAAGAPLSPEQQLAAWNGARTLATGSGLMAQLLPRFEAFVSDHRDLDGMEQTAAQAFLEVGSDRAGEFLAAWTAAAADDPVALLSRLRWRLRQGDLAGALDDGMACVQAEPDRATGIAAVVAACRQDMAAAPAAAQDAVEQLARRFEGLLQ